MSVPPEPSANQGTHGVSPRARYSTIPARARRQPRAAAPSSTAKVCPVIGTGVNGSLTASWAASPVKAANPITRTASRTWSPGSTSASTRRRGRPRALCDTDTGWLLPDPAWRLLGTGCLAAQCYVAGRPRRAARWSSAKRRSQQALCQWRRCSGSPSGQTTTWRVRGKISCRQPGQRYTLVARYGWTKRRCQPSATHSRASGSPRNRHGGCIVGTARVYAIGVGSSPPMNRFEDAVARELSTRIKGRTRSVRALARWAAASLPPGALVADGVALVLARLGDENPDALAAQVMTETPDRFGRNWESGPAH